MAETQFFGRMPGMVMRQSRLETPEQVELEVANPTQVQKEILEAIGSQTAAVAEVVEARAEERQIREVLVNVALKAETLLSREEQLAVVGRILEHSTADGVELIERLELGGNHSEMRELFSSPAFLLKHPQFADAYNRFLRMKGDARETALSALLLGKKDKVYLLRTDILESVQSDDERAAFPYAEVPGSVDNILAEIDAAYTPLLHTMRLRAVRRPDPNEGMSAGEKLADRYLEVAHDALERNLNSGQFYGFLEQNLRVTPNEYLSDALLSRGVTPDELFLVMHATTIPRANAEAILAKIGVDQASGETQSQLDRLQYKPLGVTTTVMNAEARRLLRKELTEELAGRDHLVRVERDSNGLYQVIPEEAVTIRETDEERYIPVGELSPEQFSSYEIPGSAEKALVTNGKIAYTEKESEGEDNRKSYRVVYDGQTICSGVDNISSFSNVDGRFVFVANSWGEDNILYVDGREASSFRGNGKVNVMGSHIVNVVDSDRPRNHRSFGRPQKILVDGRETNLDYDSVERASPKDRDDFDDKSVVISDRLMFVGERDGYVHLVQDGIEVGTPIEGEAQWVTEVGGQIAFSVKTKSGSVVYHGTKELSGPHEIVRHLREMNGKVAYTAGKEGEMYVMVDGIRTNGPYEMIDDLVTVNGEAAVIAGRHHDFMSLYKGDKELEKNVSYSGLLGSGGKRAYVNNIQEVGGRLVYIKQGDNQSGSRLIVNGEVVDQRASYIHPLPPDGRSLSINGILAYEAVDASPDGKRIMIEGNQVGEHYDEIHSARFQNGKMIAYVSVEGESWVVVDGQRTLGPFDSEEKRLSVNKDESGFQKVENIGGSLYVLAAREGKYYFMQDGNDIFGPLDKEPRVTFQNGILSISVMNSDGSVGTVHQFTFERETESSELVLSNDEQEKLDLLNLITTSDKEAVAEYMKEADTDDRSTWQKIRDSITGNRSFMWTINKLAEARPGLLLQTVAAKKDHLTVPFLAKVADLMNPGRNYYGQYEEEEKRRQQELREAEQQAREELLASNGPMEPEHHSHYDGSDYSYTQVDRIGERLSQLQVESNTADALASVLDAARYSRAAAALQTEAVGNAALKQTLEAAIRQPSVVRGDTLPGDYLRQYAGRMVYAGDAADLPDAYQQMGDILELAQEGSGERSQPGSLFEEVISELSRNSN